MPKCNVERLELDTDIPVLGECRVPNPIPYCRYLADKARIQLPLDEDEMMSLSGGPVYCEFELAGPRENLYFDSSKVKCAIVTSGGLTPGTNYVIRSIVLEAHHNYKLAATLGIRYGFQGFIPSYGHNVMELTPASVADIHHLGGTILGSSRGPQAPEEVADALQRMNISILFIIGGDGALQAAQRIQETVAERGEKIAIIGIPKTIDNDINFVSPSFGFDTAVGQATESIRCAHVEATGAKNGIGMVRVMGREAGFIAAHATLAMKEVNFVLIPEYPFVLEGDNGLLPSLERRLKERGHAVIVVAEGAGQHLLQRSGDTDASGNPVLGDICAFLIKEIRKYFKSKGMEHNLKFIDPSYIIRSVPANSYDRVYCGLIGQHAVHAAMAGRTGMIVSRLHDHYIHLPLSLVTRKRKRINIYSDYWRSVLESTGQDPYTTIYDTSFRSCPR